MKRSSFILPILFFLVTVYLLTLPGDEFPKGRFFELPGLDKIVHVTMFFLLVWLFCRPFKKYYSRVISINRIFLLIGVLAFSYGIIIEFVQKYFVPFRSFELADILVDGLGAAAGYLVSRKMFGKEKAV